MARRAKTRILIGDESGRALHEQPRVFVVSDTRLLCEGLVLALSGQRPIKTLGWSGLTEAASRVEELDLDVLLLDIGSPGALEAASGFRKSLPNLRIVAIAVAEIDQDLVACAEAGIVGFVSRDGSAEDVHAAIQAALRGELVCSPRVSAMLFNRIGTWPSKLPARVDFHALTEREQEIVSLLDEGLSNKEIARALRIQSATVKNHVHSILGKLRVSRRGQAAAQVRKLNLTRSQASHA
jgi:DNA-binding NarL/FixJ family response regulator